MKISEILKNPKPTISYEVFPPKNSASFDTVMSAALKIGLLEPSFMSVTYGAGGGTSEYTAKIAEGLMTFGVTTLAHLSCISSTHETIHERLDDLRARGIENIMALRGDIPEGFDRSNLEYRYASELISEIRDYGGFCIGGACYPESHPESETSAADIESLRIKVECGCEFLTTQMFFDNNILYNFLWRLRSAGVDVPVIAGIMPVTNAKSIRRICGISATSLPQRFIRIVERFGDDQEALTQAGIAYATEQIIDLFANGVNAVHVYSMNKPEVAAAIRNNISSIIA